MDQDVVRYNQLLMKSSHNSYSRDESIVQQLAFHRCRVLECDIHIGQTGRTTVSGSWYVYHIDIIDTTTSVRTFNDYLKELKAYHNSFSNHDIITIWIDSRDTFISGHSASDLDTAISNILGANVFKPADLQGSYSSLQEAVGAVGWPQMCDLRGKFMFVMAENANSYIAGGGSTCFKSITASGVSDVTAAANSNVVFFNQGGYDSTQKSIFTAVFNNGFIGRRWTVNSSSDWNDCIYPNVTNNAYVHQIATDYINYHSSTWSCTHNNNGYPFKSITGSDSSTCVSDDGPWIGIDAYVSNGGGGDFDGTSDNIHFLYQNIAQPASGTTYTWTAIICNCNSHVDNWSKCGIIARASLASNSPYFGIVLPSDDYNQDNSRCPRYQYRTTSGGSTSKGYVLIPPTLGSSSGITNEYRFYAKLTLYWNGTDTVCTAYASHDGSTYTSIYQKTIAGWLPYHGICGSPHDSGNTFDDGCRISYGFGNLKKNGVLQTVSNFTSTNLGNSAGTRQEDKLLIF